MLKPIVHRRERDRWLLALLAALLIMAVTYALCRPIYETNDDSSIVAAASGAVTGAPYAGNGFTSYLYGALLGGLFSLNAQLPWHTLFLLGVAFLSLAALIKCFTCVGERLSVPAAVLWAVFAGLYAGVLLPYVAMLQFTTIAAMAASGGTGLMLCAGAGSGRAARFDRSVAGVLLLCAFGLRVQSLWAAMPLLAAYGVLAWLESPRRGRKTALCCGAALVLLGLLTIADSALYRYNEPGWDAFCAYNDRLSDLLDYNNTGLVDELAAEAAGWPSWTTYMVRNWYQLDERMTLDSLTALTDAIAEARPASTAVSLLRATGSVLLNYPMFSFTLAGFGVFALWAFVSLASRKRIWGCLAIVGPAAYLIVFVAYFYGVLGRLPERAAFTAACPCYVLLALSCLRAFAPEAAPMGLLSRRLAAAAACALLLLCAVPTVANAPERLPLRWQEQSRDSARALSGRMCAYACAHPDRIYVTDAPLDHDPFYVYGNALPVNLIEWCNGMFHSPMYQEKLRVLGFDSFTSRTLLKEGVYLLLSGEGVLNNLKGYLEAEYGPVTVQTCFLGDGFLECALRPAA